MIGSIKMYEPFLERSDWQLVEALVHEAADFRDFSNKLVEKTTAAPVSDGLLVFNLRMVTFLADTDAVRKLKPLYSGNKLFTTWRLWALSHWDASLNTETIASIEDLLNQDIDTWIRIELYYCLIDPYSIIAVEKAREPIQEAMSLIESDPIYAPYRGWFLTELSTIQWNLNNYHDALRIAREAVTAARESDDTLSLPHALNLLALSSPVPDQFAIYEEMISLLEDTDQVFMLEVALNNYGFAYLTQGDYSKAIAQFERAVKIVVEKQMPSYHPFLNLSTIFANLGDIDAALSNAQRGFEVAKAVNPRDAKPYLVLARALVLKGQYEEAFRYLDPAGEIAFKSGNEKWQAGYYFVRGEYEQKKGNLGNAKHSFRRSLELAQSIQNLQYIIQSSLHLAEVSISEFFEDEDEEHINEAYASLDVLSQIADEQGFTGLQVQIAVLKAQIAKLLGNIDDARRTLESALDICTEFKLDNLRTIVETQLDQLDTKESSKSLFGRFKDFVGQISILGIKPRRIKFQVLGCIVILRGSGIEVFAKYLDDRLTSDPSLVAGLITAVSSFAKELKSGAKGTLQSIVHEDIAVLLEHREEITCAFLCDKDCSEARMLERTFVEKFVEAHQSELSKFEEGFAQPVDASDLFTELIAQWQR